MELVRRGNKNKRTYTAECPKCGSVFRAARDELKITHDRDGECIQTETCTECGAYGLRFGELIEPPTTETVTKGGW